MCISFITELVDYHVRYVHEPIHAGGEAALGATVHCTGHLIDTLVPACIHELMNVGVETCLLTRYLEKAL